MQIFFAYFFISYNILKSFSLFKFVFIYYLLKWDWQKAKQAFLYFVCIILLSLFQSIFFDEPSNNKFPLLRDHDARSPPDWVNGELSEPSSSVQSGGGRQYGEPNATSTLRDRYNGSLDIPGGHR